jgi:tetratricopeptide (TPR) repeat protein
VAIVPRLGNELHDDQRMLRDDALVARVPVDVMHTHARAAMLRHPVEPYLPFIVGLRAAVERDENPMPWIGATLERANVYGPAHLVLARVVAPRSPSQARLEYRLAVEQAPELEGTVEKEAPPLVGNFDDAMELVPPGKLGVRVLISLIDSVGARLPAARVKLDAELAARDPTAPGPVRRAAEDAVADLEAGDAAPWCTGAARAACVTRAVGLAKSLQQLEAGKCAGFALEARARAAGGDAKRALTDLEKASEAAGERVVCLKEVIRVAGTAGDEPRIERALEEIAHAGCSEDRECVANLVYVAQTEENRGSPRRALAMYKRAYERAPDEDSLLMQMARLAAQVELHAEAVEDYEKLARRRPAEAQWREAAAREREALMRSVVKL